jgi:hypothetical protein
VDARVSQQGRKKLPVTIGTLTLYGPRRREMMQKEPVFAGSLLVRNLHHIRR